MRVRILVALALLLLTTPVYAQAAATGTFSWTGSVVDAAHSAPTKYTLKCGTTTGGPYTAVVKDITGSPLPTSIAAATVVTSPIALFCVVTASNLGVESGNSNEVAFPSPPNPVTNAIVGP